MYTVGRFIGRGFSTVSGPFHPFGGAVDIVVVEQPDGSFKSSPWYVRFGKFQGVLKTREKVVSICVNGVEAGFHMYLDHTGEAYFLEEVEEEITVDFSSSGESKGELTKPLSCNLDAEGSLLARSETVASESSASSVTGTGSKRSRMLGLVWGRKLSLDESSPEISRATSLDQAKIVADLLDVNWSTELATEKSKPYISSQLSECIVSSDECKIDGDSLSETNLASSSAAGPFVQEPSGLISGVSQNFVDLQIGDVRNNEKGSKMFHINSAETLLDSNSLQERTTDSTEESLETRQSLQSNGLVPQCEVKLMTLNKSYYSLQNPRGSSTSVDDTMDCVRTAIREESSSSLLVEDVGLKNCHRTSGLKNTIYRSELDQSINAESHEDEQFIFSDDELKPDDDQKTSVSTSSSVDKELDTLTTTDDPRLRSHVSLASIEVGHQVDAEKKFEDLLEKEQQKMFFPIDINEFHDASTDIDERMVESLPNLWSHIDSLEAEHRPRRSFDASTTSPRWLNLRSNISCFKKPVVDIETDLDKSQVTVTDDGPPETLKSNSVSSGVGDPSKTIVVPTGTWRLWPFSFQRAPSSKSTTSSANPSTVADVTRSTKGISLITDTKPEVQHKVIKKKMRTITPTSVQIASLGLKEGGTIITFTFSTAMLGKQQVDGRIYLWKWNDRVVISDVDGTITRSDVLGQFMPMVGYDWSHIGVAHLFSAIKENGYQLLFLSARSISQSHLTRQFLFNLKQDGKALPDGPVVISPDGLFPSLFREVIRRAPHEFKIACLEDIKELFPRDRNPFYAGFGNRDTDEISYLRVGIPEGKIFIINPKGEVAVHRRVDTNSYSDLYSLVNGMFPVFSSSEQQEAFNSWNFWKLPPRMDFEI